VAEAEAVYSPRKKKNLPIRAGTQEFEDLETLPAFGMWADRTETDEELLDVMKSGWGPPPGGD
jgi:hypothetical protein